MSSKRSIFSSVAARDAGEHMETTPGEFHDSEGGVVVSVVQRFQGAWKLSWHVVSLFFVFVLLFRFLVLLALFTGFNRPDSNLAAAFLSYPCLSPVLHLVGRVADCYGFVSKKTTKDTRAKIPKSCASLWRQWHSSRLTRRNLRKCRPEHDFITQRGWLKGAKTR